MSTIQIGSKLVGDDQPCFIIAEIGINHNGDIDLAKRLISVAAAAQPIAGRRGGGFVSALTPARSSFRRSGFGQ